MLFRSKKRGLRSIKSAVVILVVVFLMPIITAVVVSRYFSVAPIYPKYDEVIDISKSDKNGYIYLKSAEIIAKRIYDNFIHTNLVKYRPSSQIGNRYLFDYKQSTKAPDYVHFIVLLDIYKPYIKSGNLKNVLASVNRSIEKSPALPAGAPPAKLENISPKITPENWEREFLKYSDEVLNNIKKANRSCYLVKYPLEGGQNYPVDIPLGWEIISVALVSCVINFESGNYSKAMDWLEHITALAVKCYENSIRSGAVLTLVQILYANLLIIDYLPEWVYEDIFCVLNHAKEAIATTPFSKKFELILLVLENSFRVGERHERMGRFEQLWVTFTNYRTLSKMLENETELFLNASWDNVENSIVNRDQGVIKRLNEFRRMVYYMYPNELWAFCSGTMIENSLFDRNYSLAGIYAGMFFTLAKEYQIRNGKMPKSIREVLSGRLPEDELKWFESLSSVVTEPRKIYLIATSMEPWKEMKLRRLTRITRFPDSFPYGLGCLEMVLE